jgi:hypothetical protein
MWNIEANFCSYYYLPTPYAQPWVQSLFPLPPFWPFLCKRVVSGAVTLLAQAN